jgi:hypothetical protein
VLIAGGAWLRVKFFAMPYRGFSKEACRAEEQDVCWLPSTLDGSDYMLSVLKILTKPSSSVYSNLLVKCLQ